MKAILIILVVALGGLTYKFQLDAKAAKALVVAAEDAEFEAKEEAKKASDALSEATRKIATLEKAVATHLAEIDTLKRAEIAAVANPSSPGEYSRDLMAKIDQSQDRKKAKLAELKRIYDENVAQIETARATLVGNMTKAKAIETNLRKNPPKFSEQGEVYRNGERVITGVRTLAADRKVVMEEYQEQLTQIAAQIGAIEAEMTALSAKEAALENSYDAAVQKAVSEVD